MIRWGATLEIFSDLDTLLVPHNQLNGEEPTCKGPHTPVQLQVAQDVFHLPLAASGNLSETPTSDVVSWCALHKGSISNRCMQIHSLPAMPMDTSCSTCDLKVPIQCAWDYTSDRNGRHFTPHSLARSVEIGWKLTISYECMRALRPSLGPSRS